MVKILSKAADKAKAARLPVRSIILGRCGMTNCLIYLAIAGYGKRPGF